MLQQLIVNFASLLKHESGETEPLWVGKPKQKAADNSLHKGEGNCTFRSEFLFLQLSHDSIISSIATIKKNPILNRAALKQVIKRKK